MPSEIRKIANSPTVHTRDSACTYLCVSSAPVIITDSAPLALKENLHTALMRWATTHKTNWRGTPREAWFWNVRNKSNQHSTTSANLTECHTVEPALAVTWIRRSPLHCSQLGKVPNCDAPSPVHLHCYKAVTCLMCNTAMQPRPNHNKLHNKTTGITATTFQLSLLDINN